VRLVAGNVDNVRAVKMSQTAIDPVSKSASDPRATFFVG